MVGWTPYMGANDNGGISHHTPVQIWCICHHPLGQMTMVSWTPYMEASDYGASVTIVAQCKYGAFDTMLWGKWL